MNKPFFGYNNAEEAHEAWGQRLQEGKVETKIINRVVDATRWPQETYPIAVVRIELPEAVINY